MNVTDLSEDVHSRTIKGFYHHLFNYHYSGGIATAKTLAFTFPAGVDLVQLLILRSVIEVDDNGFSDIRWIQRLGGLEQRSARGRASVAPPVAGNRDKYDLVLTAHKNTADDISRALDAFFAEYPEFVDGTETFPGSGVSREE